MSLHECNQYDSEDSWDLTLRVLRRMLAIVGLGVEDALPQCFLSICSKHFSCETLQGFVVFEAYEEQGVVSVIGQSIILIVRVTNLYLYACLLVVDQPTNTWV